MNKDAAAFRTISEVSEELGVPQHVLRFWETRFPQIKPLKRGGGRRYYRRDEIDLLGAIRSLLYEDGYTIKGVQRILKEQGVRAVALLARQPAGTRLPPPETSDDSDDVVSPIEDEAEPEDDAPGVAQVHLRRRLGDIARELDTCVAILADARAAGLPG